MDPVPCTGQIEVPHTQDFFYQPDTPDRSTPILVETGQIPVQIQIYRRIWELAGLTGLPAGLTGNRSVCLVTGLNKYLYNIF